MSITTVDNFNSKICNEFTKINKNGFEYTLENNKDYLFNSSKSLEDINITLKIYKENQNKLFSLLDDDKRKDDDLIISVSSYLDPDGITKIYTTQTGNYIGKFTYNKIDIDIKSRFSDIFLKRMLNFANDVYLDTYVFDAQKDNKKDLDYSKFIIYYIFIQKLEKAFLLGLPKAYKSINHHEMKVKGKIDINRYIKYDIPFKGKISSSSREQKEIQEIIDVLYKAISVIEKNKFSTKNISHIKKHLKQHRSNKYVSNETIVKAIKSKALNNPIFTPYKKVLEYAKLIIDLNNLEEKKDTNKETFGFLVNVAELFEIYLVKLLQYKMPEWNVAHEPELNLYKDNFYSRMMKPDIVMEKDNKVMVFDAKYKRMTFKKGIGDGKYGDLDRSDFFQINTYMSYYNNQENTTLIAGGLLYPMEANLDETEQSESRKAHSDNWFGDESVKFIVNGIDLSNIEKDTDGLDDEGKAKKMIENIKDSEKNFINKLRQLGGNQYE